ncbi:methyltransferase domain-containing protein [Candidatus Bathyarchaeota archaeon]|nr:methyltransferase domain-containing protein [Candidatus Bathyarchaeota archaeon]
MDNEMKDHWNEVYDYTDIKTLGWYEDKPTPCLRLLAKCNIEKSDPILDVGAGASTFIDCLLEGEYANIIAADISEVALNKLKERLGVRKASKVKWIIDDISKPAYLYKLEKVAVWHDRAVLHFLLETDQIQTYFSTLKKIVRNGGYVIIAAFSLKGAKKCSGLDVKNYDSNMLMENLGEEFHLIEALDYDYRMPSGDIRPYIYTLFQRQR